MPQVPHLLLIMVALPFLGSILAASVSGLGRNQVRTIALVNVLLSFLLSVIMAWHYDPFDKTETAKAKAAAATAESSAKVKAPVRPVFKSGAALLQMETNLPWLGAKGGPDIRFHVGVDGISLWLICLTNLLMIPAVLVSWNAISDRPAAFYSLLLLLQAGMVGVFSAQDLILFYLFFEFTLIPLFFLIGLWGGHDRRWAAQKFFVYTFAGSALTFLGLLFIVLSYSWMSGQPKLVFSIPELTTKLPAVIAQTADNQAYWGRVSPWIFLALFAGFAIKVPLFPFHTWLPLAHVEAPTAGSVLLAGVLLKIGSYGFLRFALPLVPEACWGHFHIIGWLSTIGIIYGALLALAQDDIKKLVAYSSVSHMGLCLMGLFSLNIVGMTGGMLQMINHGLSTGALFTIVGMLYERYHTRDIEAFGGLTRKLPIMAFFLVVTTFSSIGLPGLNGFPGEITSLMGMFRENFLFGALGLTGIILGAWYMLSLVARTFFGRLREPVIDAHGHHAQGPHAPEAHPIHDLGFREIAALTPLVVMMVAIGLFPQFFIDRFDPSLRQIAQTLAERRNRTVKNTAAAQAVTPVVAAAQTER